MAQSPTELYREATVAIATLTERLDNVRKDLAGERARVDRLADAVDQLRTQVELLRQQSADHQRRQDEWGRRLWGLVPVLVGAVLSLASGLIVTLARK